MQTLKNTACFESCHGFFESGALSRHEAMGRSGPRHVQLQRLFDEQRAPKPLEQPARPAHRILDCPDFWLE